MLPRKKRKRFSQAVMNPFPTPRAKLISHAALQIATWKIKKNEAPNELSPEPQNAFLRRIRAALFRRWRKEHPGWRAIPS